MATAEALFKKVAKMYEPGGVSTAGIKSSLERARTKFLSSGMQNLVSAGLANTTLPAGLAGKFAEEVETPTLAASESERIRNLANVYMTQAQLKAQTEQAQLDRALQQRLTVYGMQQQRPAGYNVFGEPMPGTPAYEQTQQGTGKTTQPAQTNVQDLTALYSKIKSLQAPIYYTSNPVSTIPTLSSTMTTPQTWTDEELQALNKRMGNVL